MRRPVSTTGRAEALCSSSQSSPSGLLASHSLKRSEVAGPVGCASLGCPGVGAASCHPAAKRAIERSAACGPNVTASAGDPSGWRRRTDCPSPLRRKAASSSRVSTNLAAGASVVPCGKVNFAPVAGLSVRPMPLSSAGVDPALWSSMKSGPLPRAKISLSWTSGGGPLPGPKTNERSWLSKDGWPSASVWTHFQK